MAVVLNSQTAAIAHPPF